MKVSIKRRAGKLLLRCGIVALVIALIVAWFIGGSLCAPNNHTVKMPKDLAVEAVTFPSESGSTIHGWLVTPATNRGVVILQHGVRSCRTALVSRARFLSKAGYSVLLFDFQGHGESPGKLITLGHLESRDSQAAVAFVNKRFPAKPVAVIGQSLGAAAAALANPPLPVQAVVLEMMYPTIIDATKDRCELVLGPLARVLSPLLTWQIKFRIGCDTADLCPIEQVGKMTVPKLFVAGTKDRHTKFSEAKEIFARAAEPKSFESIEGAKHQDLYAYAPERYETLILNFLSQNLK